MYVILTKASSVANTSQGLDSQGALSIVRLLRRLADSGQAIICTIHQASQEQFNIVSDGLESI